MEAGGLLYCHTTGYMDSGKVFAYAGKEYLIEKIYGNNIILSTECGSGHSWLINEPIFGQYFSTEKRRTNSWGNSTIKFNFV